MTTTDIPQPPAGNYTVGTIHLQQGNYDLNLRLRASDGSPLSLPESYPLPTIDLATLMNDVIFTATHVEEYLQNQELQSLFFQPESILISIADGAIAIKDKNHTEKSWQVSQILQASSSHTDAYAFQRADRFAQRVLGKCKPEMTLKYSPPSEQIPTLSLPSLENLTPLNAKKAPESLDTLVLWWTSPESSDRWTREDLRNRRRIASLKLLLCEDFAKNREKLQALKTLPPAEREKKMDSLRSQLRDEQSAPKRDLLTMQLDLLEKIQAKQPLEDDFCKQLFILTEVQKLLEGYEQNPTYADVHRALHDKIHEKWDQFFTPAF